MDRPALLDRPVRGDADGHRPQTVSGCHGGRAAGAHRVDERQVLEVAGAVMKTLVANLGRQRRRNLDRANAIAWSDPDHPADSYLLFLGDEPNPNATTPAENVLSVDTNDGRLTAREIFAQRINARLIILSACYSGLGDRSPLPGDDLFGLQRAFLHAGARSVLSGLWDVYDGTAPDLIRQFHEQVVAGKSPSQALAESQRVFLNQRRSGDKRDEAVFLHPYFWSVFCVVGAE